MSREGLLRLGFLDGERSARATAADDEGCTSVSSRGTEARMGDFWIGSGEVPASLSSAGAVTVVESSVVDTG